jgi:FkbM family methyltransferase
MKVHFFDSFTVDVDPRAVARGGSFYEKGAYAPDGLRRVYDALRVLENPVLLDVGANSGSYTLLTTLLPTLEVYAFEPVKESRKLLTKHVRMNNVHERVHIFKCAVGNYDGYATLWEVGPESQSALSIVNGNPSAAKQVVSSKVPMLTLDTICKQKSIQPDLIKIDVEGGELAALDGAIEVIDQCGPIIQTEANPYNLEQFGQNPQNLEAWLANVGYVVTAMPDGDFWAVRV